MLLAFSLAAAWDRKPPKEEVVKVTLRPLSQDDTLASKCGLSEVIASQMKDAFPAARFYRGFDNTLPPVPYMIAVAKDKRYAMPAEFNRLLSDNGMKVTANNVVSLAKAFVICAVGGWYLSIPEITFLGATRISPRIEIPGSELTMIMGERAEKLELKMGERTEEWRFYVWRSQFREVSGRDANGLTTGFYHPLMVESLPKR